MCKRIFEFELQLRSYWQNIKFSRYCPKFPIFTNFVIFQVYLQLLRPIASSLSISWQGHVRNTLFHFCQLPPVKINIFVCNTTVHVMMALYSYLKQCTCIFYDVQKDIVYLCFVYHCIWAIMFVIFLVGYNKVWLDLTWLDPGIFQSYHLENTPHSSRILRQLVCTVTCMGFNGISESFFPSQDTIWSIILFTMYYFTAINIFLSLHYTEILNSIIIPSIPYRTRHARSLSLRATQFWEKTNSQQTLTYDNFLFLTDLLIQHSPDL